MGPYPHIELPKCDTLQDCEIDYLLNQANIPRPHQEFFVVCKSPRQARYLLNECFRLIRFPVTTKVNTLKREIKTEVETIRFVTRDQLDMLLTGRHDTRVVLQWELEEALDRFREKGEKKMSNYDPVYEAYRLLVAARDGGEDPSAAIDEAIGFLGEALDN